MSTEDPRTPQFLSAILWVGGIAAIAIGAVHTVFGTASIPGGARVNATLAGEDRFYAVIFVGYGCAVVWAARDVIGRSRAITWLVGLFFLGGVVRAVSWFWDGPPHLFFKLMTGLELMLPILLWWLQVKAASIVSGRFESRPNL